MPNSMTLPAPPPTPIANIKPQSKTCAIPHVYRTKLEYKYIVYLANGTLGYWQPGPNGTLDLEAAGGARFQVTEGWCDTPRQIEVFSPVPTAPAAPQVGAGDRGGAGAAAGRGLRLLKARVSAAGGGWGRGCGRGLQTQLVVQAERGLHGRC